jgi:hypothetical protein
VINTKYFTSRIESAASECLLQQNGWATRSVAKPLGSGPTSVWQRHGRTGARLLQCPPGIFQPQVGGNWGFDDPQTLCDEPDTMVSDEVPFDTRSIFIGIAELAKDERGAAIQFSLLRNDKLALRRLEAVVEGRAHGKRAVSPEVVQPSKEVLGIDGQSAPFHAGVGGQHAVGDITHGPLL